MPTPRFVTALNQTASGMVNASNPSDPPDQITEEAVSIGPGGVYLVRGIEVRSRSSIALQEGDIVAVQWAKGKPFMILNLQSRSGPGTDEISTGGVTEELFIAPVAISNTKTSMEVWYRSGNQVKNLDLRSKTLDSDPQIVRWGTVDNQFLVMTKTHTFYVFKLNRAPRSTLGGIAKAALIRKESPLDVNLLLCRVSRTYTLNLSETRYWTIDWPAPPDPTSTMHEAASDPIFTVGTEDNRPLFLTRAMVETEFPVSPSVLITDIRLDGAGDLILCLSVNLDKALGPLRLDDALSTHKIEASNGGGGTDTIGPQLETWVPGTTTASLRSKDVTRGVRLSTHALVLNTTKRAVLFKTCRDALGDFSTVEAHRLHTYKLIEDAPVSSPFNAGQIFDLPSAATSDSQKGKNGTWLTAWDTPPGPTDDFTYVLKCAPGDPEQAAVVDQSVLEYESDFTPYLDLSGTDTQVDIQPGAIVVHRGVQAYLPSAPGFFSSVHSIKANFSTYQAWRLDDFLFSCVYLPRTSKNLGFLLVKVLQLHRSSPNQDPVPSEGLFLHDLATGVVKTIQPLTVNYRVRATQGIVINGAIYFPPFSPEADGAVVVIGFNGRHLLWIWDEVETFNGPDLVEIRLTDVVTGTTKVVLSGNGAVDDGHGNAVYEAKLQALMARDLKVVTPDALYYRHEPTKAKPPVPAEVGNGFIQGWKSDGTPTLDATATGFPVLDRKLRDLGGLKQLPKDVTPNAPTVIAVNKGPVNVPDLTDTGPAVHVVGTPTIGTALGKDVTRS